ncbi:MAG: hypothetical protein MMC33_002031 [Icmadophila ericetorum]|nr:hypothetical protein [Icmadophila ericetorum]
MTAPPEITMSSLTGKWILSKKSDDWEPLLGLQGVPWIKRRAANYITLTDHLNQYTDDAGLDHVDVKQTVTGGFKGGVENRTLNWEVFEGPNETFGQVKDQCKWLGGVEELDQEHGAEFLKEGWIMDEGSGEQGKRLLLATMESVKLGWRSVAVWGFQMIDGERWHVRKVAVKKGDQVLTGKAVYDWGGK